MTQTRNRALSSPYVIIGGEKKGGGLPRRKIVVKLVGGPCDGEYAGVLAFGARCWQRIGTEDMWALYTKNFTTRGEFLFGNEIIGLVELAAKMAAQGKGNVMGSYGA